MASVGLPQLLDYVCAFIIKGLSVIQRTQCGMALVSTSSICQGEQVALLWPTILDTATINFAYRPFKWANSAANNAGVWRSEEHTSELQSLMRISYAVFC